MTLWILVAVVIYVGWSLALIASTARACGGRARGLWT